MGQVSKVLGSCNEAPAEAFTKAVGLSAASQVLEAASAATSSQESCGSAPKAKTFDLNAKAAAFQPSQSLTHDEVDRYVSALQFNLDPEAPAYIMPSMAVTNLPVDPFLSSTSMAASMVPCQLPCDFQEPPGLEMLSNASTTLDSLPRWSTPPASLDSLPSPRQFMNTRSRPGKMRPDNRVNQGPKGEAAVNKDGKQNETMKAQLEMLKLEDPECVFIARGINKLGFSSPKILRAYFSRYGEVKAIHVSPSRVKSMYKYGDHTSTEPHWRLRAAPLGFVVMKSSDATAQILKDGPAVDVNGVPVRLQPFNRHSEQKDADSGNEGDH